MGSRGCHSSVVTSGLSGCGFLELLKALDAGFWGLRLFKGLFGWGMWLLLVWDIWVRKDSENE